MGVLYIVATPIGNLKDITLRALEVLKEADLILAEDTRVTKKLLFHYGIEKTVWRYDENIGEKSRESIKEELVSGRKIALVTDAGTPAIADPGSRLVDFLRKEAPETNIIPIPGPSALIAALSAAGFGADRFAFLGYPPHKKGRETFFRELGESSLRPAVFYESTHRIRKAFENLQKVFGGEKEIVVAKELTKIHEEIFRGQIKKALEYFQGEKEKGEFVIIIP
jgi:16S rRNA (cytidine1402-2'-O)-methyltransferase